MRWRWRRRCPPEHPRSNPPRPKADTPATPAGNSEEQLANDAGTTFPRPSPSAGTIDLRTLLDGVKDDDGTTCVGAPRGSRGSIAIGEDRRSVNAGLADGGRKGERGKGHRPQATSGTLRDLFEAAGVTLPARYPRWRWHRRVERATGLKGRGGRKGKGGWRRPVGLRVGARAHRGRTREQGRGCPATGRDPRDSGEPGGCIRCGCPLARVQAAPPASRQGSTGRREPRLGPLSGQAAFVSKHTRRRCPRQHQLRRDETDPAGMEGRRDRAMVFPGLQRGPGAPNGRRPAASSPAHPATRSPLPVSPSASSTGAVEGVDEGEGRRGRR